jgi:hypothetical protein
MLGHGSILPGSGASGKPGAVHFAGDRGVWRGHWQATQQGEWQGIAASGRNVTWTVIIIGRFAGGKLIEDWVELDRLGLFQQLGCIPTGSQDRALFR